MPRTYSVRIAALITGAPVKWLDNLLSRHGVAGVMRSHQGIERRISDDGMLAVELCRILNLELGVSLRQAAMIANACMGSARDAALQFTTPSGLILQLPVQQTRTRLRERATDAVDMLGETPRGRPRRRR